MARSAWVRGRSLRGLAGLAAVGVLGGSRDRAQGHGCAHPAGVSQATELDPTLGPVVIQPVTVP